LNADRALQLKASVRRFPLRKSPSTLGDDMRQIPFFILFFAVLCFDGALLVAQDNSKSDGPVQSGEQVYDPKEVDTRAVILSKPEPDYTDEARQKDFSGTVLLEIILSSSGKVTEIKVLDKLPYGLTESAIKAVRQIKFKPATKDGRPVSQRIKAEYHFNLWKKIYFGDRSKLVYYEQGCSQYSAIALADKIYFKSSKEAKKAGYTKAKDRCP
jgi:TonB family protein